MERPTMAPPIMNEQLPLGPATQSGVLYDVSSGMRTFRPVIDPDQCINCLRCFLLCPDGAIDKSGALPEFDYHYCKGCGVCMKACKPGAIHMVKEGEA